MYDVSNRTNLILYFFLGKLKFQSFVLTGYKKVRNTSLFPDLWTYHETLLFEVNSSVVIHLPEGVPAIEERPGQSLILYFFFASAGARGKKLNSLPIFFSISDTE